MDDSRFKIWLAARQVGKSFAAACEAVTDCLLRPKQLWVVLSAGERQALEVMRTVRMWSEACALDIEEYSELRPTAQALLKAAEVRFGNGSRVVALPANPDTARGYSANLVLDEFAFHQDSASIWRAILPSIANPLRGQLKVRVLSTPNGHGNAFHSLWTEEGGDWHRHKTTIHDAKAAGLDVDTEELRRQLADPDGWAQEFECEFIDSSNVLLPYDLVQSCESAEASADWPNEPVLGDIYLGVDVGRHRDLTVIWAIERVADVLWTRAVLALEKAPFAEQKQTIIGLMDNRLRPVRKACIDCSGIGAMMAEELSRQYGWRVESCMFTAAFKSDLFPPLRRAFEERTVRVPIDREVREDLHALRKTISPSGQTTYEADRTSSGHADRAIALALALRAAEAPGKPAMFRAIGGPRGLRLRVDIDERLATC
jgi:phage FluMu gp28-like protein